MYRPELFGKKDETKTTTGSSDAFKTTTSSYSTGAIPIPSANIKVVGAGGAGGNTVNRMIESGLQGVEFWTMNTDLQVLQISKAQNRIQLGKNVTKGLGCGQDPEKGAKSADESKDEIVKALDGADMVFITAGMGGGTGTGSAPIIAQIAKELNALTIAVVSKPFAYEGKKRMKNALEGIEKLKDIVDAIIVVPNEKLLSVLKEKITFSDALHASDQILMRGVQGITDIITFPGEINVDFADIKAVMESSGAAIMGMGHATGEGRAVEAAKQAISHALLETSIFGASGVIVNITGGPDLTMNEIAEANQIIQDAISEDATFISGIVKDERIQGDIQITVIATGFDLKNADDKAGGYIKSTQPIGFPALDPTAMFTNAATQQSSSAMPPINNNTADSSRNRDVSNSMLDLPPFFQK